MKTLTSALIIASLIAAYLGLPVEAHEQDSVPELPYKYVGNMDSGKFHRPSCPYAKVMNRIRKRFFHFRHEATDLGQVPCRYCLPPIVRSVRASIRPEQDDQPDSKANKSSPRPTFHQETEAEERQSPNTSALDD
jgi:hypothetical protein